MTTAKLRLDHYLFKARLFKSRTKATEACREGKVLLENRPVRASTEVRENDILKIREKGLYKHIRILELPGKNMSKSDAKETWEDITPLEIRQQRELIQAAARIRGPRREGARPTKKERRQIDKLRDK